MGEHKNIVVINGKTYDALTGDVIKDSHENDIMSDFIKSNRVAKPQPVHHSKTARSTRHLAHHKPQKSVTLKRVHPKKTHGIANAKSLPLPASQIVTIESDANLLTDKSRHERAKQISKSSAISRFNFKATSEVEKIHQPIEVKAAPSAANSIAVVPTIETVPPTRQDLFNAALSKANSHQQTYHKTKHRKHHLAKKLGVSHRTANAVTVALFVVVLAGFITYQNVPNIALRMAATQSGLTTASLPSYRPAGFTLNRHVDSSPGQVTISFSSNSDNRSFKITQAGTSWNNQSLADNYLNGQQVQSTSQANGKTVYIYGNSNATWVKGGVWYRIEGNSSLSTDQLLKLANSL